jgi:hypothetical protein
VTTITEWRPQDFTHLGAFELIMLGAFGFALYRGVTLPWLRIVMLLGVLSQVRHADLLGLLAPIFLARCRGSSQLGHAQAGMGGRSPGCPDGDHRLCIDAKRHACR